MAKSVLSRMEALARTAPKIKYNRFINGLRSRSRHPCQNPIMLTNIKEGRKSSEKRMADLKNNRVTPNDDMKETIKRSTA